MARSKHPTLVLLQALRGGLAYLLGTKTTCKAIQFIRVQFVGDCMPKACWVTDKVLHNAYKYEGARDR